MTTIDAEERAAIRDGFARLLAEKCSEADVRRVMATPSGHDPALWQAISEMGLPALIVGADHGGIGAGPVEIEAVMEEAGAALLAGPLLSTAVLAAGLLNESDDADARTRLLAASSRSPSTISRPGSSSDARSAGSRRSSTWPPTC
jgi:alkylation response protein AidB-like acyl-CoA dehydrogenase